MKNQLFGNPGIPGQHIRAQRMANKLLQACYRQQDQFGRWGKSANKRRWFKYFHRVQKFAVKFDLKIGVIESAPEVYREPSYD